MTEALNFPETPNDDPSLSLVGQGDAVVDATDQSTTDTFYGALEGYCAQRGLRPEDVTDDNRPHFTQLVNAWAAAHGRIQSGPPPVITMELPRHFLDQSFKDYSPILGVQLKVGKHDAVKTARFNYDRQKMIGIAIKWETTFPQISIAMTILEELNDRGFESAEEAVADLLAVYGMTARKVGLLIRQGRQAKR